MKERNASKETSQYYAPDNDIIPSNQEHFQLYPNKFSFWVPVIQPAGLIKINKEEEKNTCYRQKYTCLPDLSFRVI